MATSFAELLANSELSKRVERNKMRNKPVIGEMQHEDNMKLCNILGKKYNPILNYGHCTVAMDNLMHKKEYDIDSVVLQHTNKRKEYISMPSATVPNRVKNIAKLVRYYSRNLVRPRMCDMRRAAKREMPYDSVEFVSGYGKGKHITLTEKDNKLFGSFETPDGKAVLLFDAPNVIAAKCIIQFLVSSPKSALAKLAAYSNNAKTKDIMDEILSFELYDVGVLSDVENQTVKKISVFQKDKNSDTANRVVDILPCDCGTFDVKLNIGEKDSFNITKHAAKSDVLVENIYYLLDSAFNRKL